jgi:alpha-1,6-mannosyltransferase
MEALLRRFWWLAALLLCGLTVFLGFFVRQDAFRPLLFGYSAFFILYLWIIQSVEDTKGIRIWLGISVFLRVLLLFAFPLLSDDVFRFLWDGHLVCSGENPYSRTPAEWLWAEDKPEGLTLALYDQLNSRNYATVYPPVAQLTFAFAVWIGGDSWFLGAFVLKLIVFSFELLTLHLLPQMLETAGAPRKNVLMYALNPLVILEGTGNLHYEIVLVALLLLAISHWYRNQQIRAAVCMSAAIATKLIPLIFLPFWLRLARSKELLLFYGIVGTGTVFLLSPIFTDLTGEKPLHSLLLFFQNFEFNAGIFNLFKWIGIWTTGYNPIQRIGPLLAFHILVGILIGAWVQRDLTMSGLFRNMMFALTLYLALSTTVHPWYLIPLLAFSTFTPFYYPLVWTGMAVLSYTHYMEIPFQSHYEWLTLEYLVVFIVLSFELWRFKG